MNSSVNPNSIWEALVHHALVGNGQHPLSDELRNHLEDLNINTSDDHHALLEGIGVVQLLEKAAKTWFINEEPYIPPPSFDHEIACSERSMQHLRSILDGHHSSAFAEFTELMAKNGRSLPPASLPKLLDQCVQNSDLWILIKPILGERGKWLLEQHPVWQELSPAKTNYNDWNNYKKTKKTKAFLLFRSQKPSKARESLVKLWPNFDHKTKAHLLETLSSQLSLEDEEFLEKCLLDKRKGVRIIAAAHLANLPDSRLIQRLFEIAKECLIVGDNRLIIKLPEDLPTTTQSDGIYPSGSKYPGGLKTNWLQQLLARIPFSLWEKEWKLNAPQIVQLFAQTGRPALVHGITLSLTRFRHTEGTHAQIKMWLNNGNDVFWKNPTGKTLLEEVTTDFFNHTTVHWLEQYGPFLPTDHLITYWLQTSKKQWSPQLTKIVLLGFQDIIESRRSPEWDLYQYKDIIHSAAYHSDPFLLDDFKKRWYLQSSSFGRWASEIEKFLQTLSFRSEMQIELNGSGK